MSFAEAQRQVERARAELSRADAEAVGWADAQRRDFDSHRMKPLADASAKLVAALVKAQEAQAKVERLISEG